MDTNGERLMTKQHPLTDEKCLSLFALENHVDALRTMVDVMRKAYDLGHEAGLKEGQKATS